MPNEPLDEPPEELATKPLDEPRDEPPYESEEAPDKLQKPPDELPNG